MAPSRPVHGQIDFGLWCCFSLKQFSCPPLINYAESLSDFLHLVTCDFSQFLTMIETSPTCRLASWQSLDKELLYSHSVLGAARLIQLNVLSDRRVRTEARCGPGHVWKLLKAVKHVVTHTLHIILEAKCSTSRPSTQLSWCVSLQLDLLYQVCVWCLIAATASAKEIVELWRAGINPEEG